MRTANPIHLTRRSTLGILAGTLAYATSGASPAAAFHYSADFNPREVEWYSRFRLLVTGGILSPSVTAKLLAAGCRLVAYEWSSAFYPHDPVSAPLEWQRQVLAKGSDWLLSTVPSGGGAAEPGRTAYWYDFASPDLCRSRAQSVASRIIQNGYAGAFLDTLGFEQLPPLMQDQFRNRHPGLDYNQSQSNFLAELRAALGPSRIIFSNQGYRAPAAFLPYADYDLSESVFTVVIGNRTVYRPWNDHSKPWESIRTPMENLIMPAARAFPHVRFVHLNYAGGDAADLERAALYSYVAATLWNQDNYVVSTAAISEEYLAYFTDLGNPVTDSYVEDIENDLVWRDYENATVVLASPAQITLRNAYGHRIGPNGGAYVTKR